MSTRPGGIVRLLALVGSEVAALWMLWTLGAWTGSVPLHDPGGWLATTPLETAVGALVRVAALAGCTWLLGTTVLSIAAELPGMRGLRPFARRLSLPLVRRFVEGAFAVSIGITSMTGTAFAATPTPPAAVTIAAPAAAPARNVLRASAPLAPARPLVARSQVSSAEAPPPESGCEVQAGDSLWRIAQRRLGSGSRYLEIWRANKGRVFGGKGFTDPDLIHPGWVLVLPEGAETVEPAVGPTPAAEPSIVEDPADVADPTVVAPVEPPAAVAPVEAPAPAPVATGPSVEVLPPVPSAVAEAPEVPLRRIPRSDAIRVSPRGPVEPIQAALGVGLIASLAVAGTTMLRRKAVRVRPAEGPAAPIQPRPAEHRLRAIADDEGPAWIDATLRLLTNACGPNPQDAPPRVRLVRAGALGVEVLLDEPRQTAPAGFTSDADGWLWRVDPDLTLAAARDRADAAGPLCPALAPVGTTPDGVALVDLEHVERLSIVGPADLSIQATTEIATALATAAWAKGCDLLSLDLELPECLGITPLPELAAAREAIGMARFQAGAAMADGALTTAAARCADPDREDAPPAVVLIGRALTPSETALLDELAPLGGHGVAVVSAGLLAGAQWELDIAPDGRARLAPLDLDLVLTPADVHSCAVDALAPLAERAVTLVVDEVADATSTSAEDDGPAALTVFRPSVPEQREPNAHPELTVLVLGPLAIEGAEVSPRSARMDSQILVRLACEAEPMSLDALRMDLYVDGTATDNTFTSAIKRARKRFGLDRDGLAFIGPVKNGAIGTTDGVDADLHQFRRLAAQPGGDIEALRLVRGQPFSDLPSGYDWVDAALVYRIQTEIVPVAARASAAAREAGDFDQARWAANQGLLAVPEHEGLRVERARAEAAAGDRQAFRRTIIEIEEVAADLSAEPLPETIATIEELLAGLEVKDRPRRAS